MAEPKFRERDPKTKAAKAALRKTAKELEASRKKRAAARAAKKKKKTMRDAVDEGVSEANQRRKKK